MSIMIDSDVCEACGSCAEVCPGNLIKTDGDGRAFMRRPEDCWGCTSCVKECPVQAISFYLGADIGGMGGLLTVEKHGNISKWLIVTRDGAEHVLEVNSSDANKY